MLSYTFPASVTVSLLARLIEADNGMIEIEARVANVSCKLLSSHMVFKEQEIYFKPKSIPDLLRALLNKSK